MRLVDVPCSFPSSSLALIATVPPVVPLALIATDPPAAPPAPSATIIPIAPPVPVAHPPHLAAAGQSEGIGESSGWCLLAEVLQEIPSPIRGDFESQFVNLMTGLM